MKDINQSTDPRRIALYGERDLAGIDGALSESAMLVVEQNVYGAEVVASEHQVRPAIAVHIADCERGEPAHGRAGHERHGRLERAIAVAQRPQVRGRGEIHLPVAVEIRHRHITRRGKLDRKSTRLNSSHLGISYAV